jgi:hypothetical protein
MQKACDKLVDKTLPIEVIAPMSTRQLQNKRSRGIEVKTREKCKAPMGGHVKSRCPTLMEL